MMRYFFDVDVGSPPYVDEHGVELASAEEARLEAHGLACALMRDRNTFEDDWSVTIRVHGGEHEPLYELKISTTGRMLINTESHAAT